MSFGVSGSDTPRIGVVGSVGSASSSHYDAPGKAGSAGGYSNASGVGYGPQGQQGQGQGQGPQRYGRELTAIPEDDLNSESTESPRNGRMPRPRWPGGAGGGGGGGDYSRGRDVDRWRHSTASSERERERGPPTVPSSPVIPDTYLSASYQPPGRSQPQLGTDGRVYGNDIRRRPSSASTTSVQVTVEPPVSVRA